MVTGVAPEEHCVSAGNRRLSAEFIENKVLNMHKDGGHRSSTFNFKRCITFAKCCTSIRRTLHAFGLC